MYLKAILIISPQNNVTKAVYSPCGLGYNLRFNRYFGLCNFVLNNTPHILIEVTAMFVGLPVDIKLAGIFVAGKLSIVNFKTHNCTGSRWIKTILLTGGQDGNFFAGNRIFP